MTLPSRGTDPSHEAVAEAFAEALLEDDPEALYERAPSGYLTTAPDGTILKVNATFLTWTGYSRDELVGRRRFADLLSVGGRIYHETHIAPQLRMQGSVREIAVDVMAVDGTRLPMLVNAVLERDVAGEPRLIRVAAFDATERRQYERELLAAKERAEESEARARTLARTLQQTLIPPLPPQVPGLDVAAAFRPAGRGAEVGGDFYDVFQVAADDWVVVIGDVCGKGVEAAVITALVRYTVRAVSVQTADPAEALAMVDDVLLTHGAERFCTLLLVRLRRTPETHWEATVASGGHPLPLLLRDDSVTAVGVPGTVLGAVRGGVRNETVVPLEPGDGLLLFTDGVTEARQGSRFYDEDRLMLVASGFRDRAESVVDAVLSDVLAFSGEDTRDDVAIVVVKVPGDR